jgi:sucrose-6-phosphate hydrolase SacC (GH32 family)
MLPIDLVDFYVIEESSNLNKITWITASERNNYYFILYHSSDGIEWNKTELIYGAGNSQEKKIYEVIHCPKWNQVNYYKISQTDYDGKTKEFSIISIENRKSSVTKRYNLLGEEVNQNYRGMVIEINDLGEKIKVFQN